MEWFCSIYTEKKSSLNSTLQSGYWKVDEILIQIEAEKIGNVAAVTDITHNSQSSPDKTLRMNRNIKFDVWQMKRNQTDSSSDSWHPKISKFFFLSRFNYVCSAQHGAYDMLHFSIDKCNKTSKPKFGSTITMQKFLNQTSQEQQGIHPYREFQQVLNDF